MLRHMAAQRTQPEDVARHYDRALAILEQGRDTLFVKSAICLYPPPVEETMRWLRQEIVRMREATTG
jgi:hypothetical protein